MGRGSERRVRTGGRRERFEQLVAEAIDGLPDDILALLDEGNVAIVVADAPTPEQLAATDPLEEGELLLGLYEGISRIERSSSGYGLVLPDKITLFQQALEAVCPDEETLRREVQATVIHELGHHFGLSERRLEELGW